MAVYLPAGTYLITQSIEITKSNIVLRGAGVRDLAAWQHRMQGCCACGARSVLGSHSKIALPSLQPGKTKLYMPKPLSAIYGSRREWSFGGGFVM